MYSKLNWIETKISKHGLGGAVPDPGKWTNYEAYNKKHKTKWYARKTQTTVQHFETDTANNTHCDSKITQVIYRIYKNKSETINKKKAQQYYKEKKDQMLFTGYMSQIADKYFTNLSDKYSRVVITTDAEADEVIRENSKYRIPQPDEFAVQYDDFDRAKGSDGAYTTGINRSDTSGYLIRGRKRSNLRTITAKWSYINAEDTAILLSNITSTEYILVNFLDPLTNKNKTKPFAITSKSLEAGKKEWYKSLSITIEEV